MRWIMKARIGELRPCSKLDCNFVIILRAWDPQIPILPNFDPTQGPPKEVIRGFMFLFAHCRTMTPPPKWPISNEVYELSTFAEVSIQYTCGTSRVPELNQSSLDSFPQRNGFLHPRKKSDHNSILKLAVMSRDYRARTTSRLDLVDDSGNELLVLLASCGWRLAFANHPDFVVCRLLLVLLVWILLLPLFSFEPRLKEFPSQKKLFIFCLVERCGISSTGRPAFPRQS